MTDLSPVPVWSPIVQLETNTLALGGTGNPMNVQAQALANRSAFLLEKVNSTEEDLLDHTNPLEGAAKVGRATRQIESMEELKTVPGRYDGDQVYLRGYYPGSTLGGGVLTWDAESTATSDWGATVAVVGEATGRWLRDTTQGVWVEWFGAQNNGTDDLGTTTAAVWSAIRSIRANPTELIQYIGGPTITGYTSGTVRFGRGVFALLADSFEIYQDLGLRLVGQGGRGMNQAIPGATTLLQKGVSNGFFWRAYGNAGRWLSFENLDICYENSDFTGDVIDSFAAPDTYIGKGCRVGCYGGFSATRVQSARSCVRTTYDERLTIDHAVLDGADIGVWSDVSRTLGGSSFGGWGMNLNSVTFYDFTTSHFVHGAARARFNTNMTACNFNPINISPQRVIDAENLAGYAISAPIFTPSTAAQPTIEYLKILGSTGTIENGVFLGASSKVGTVGGPNPAATTWSGNEISCQSGLTVTGGAFDGGGNEYSTADVAVDFVPAAVTTINMGPDIFKAGVGYSYRIPADSVSLGGRINYSAEQDNSVSKFLNTTTRVTIENLDHRFVTIASLPATGSATQTGRTYNVTAAGTFTLPTPIPGTRLRVMKAGATALTVAAAASSNMSVGQTAARTSAVATTAEIGSRLEFEAISASTWVVSVLSGTWTFS